MNLGKLMRFSPTKQKMCLRTLTGFPPAAFQLHPVKNSQTTANVFREEKMNDAQEFVLNIVYFTK